MIRAGAVFLCVSIFFAMAAISPAEQQDTREQEDFLNSLIGSYHVIGLFPDTRKTYSGEVNISRTGDRLIIERKINGVKTRGESSVQSATADNIPVIRAAWKQGKIEYGATYLLHTDLDNYPRLTGYVYRSGKQSAAPGLEALFFKDAQKDK